MITVKPETLVSMLGAGAQGLLDQELADWVSDIPPQKDIPAEGINTEIRPVRHAPLTKRANPATVCENRPILYIFLNSDLAATPQSAIVNWKRQFLEVIASNHGVKTIWWRCRPEINGSINHMSGKAEWGVYSRFALEMP